MCNTAMCEAAERKNSFESVQLLLPSADAQAKLAGLVGAVRSHGEYDVIGLLLRSLLDDMSIDVTNHAYFHNARFACLFAQYDAGDPFNCHGDLERAERIQKMLADFSEQWKARKNETDTTEKR